MPVQGLVAPSAEQVEAWIDQNKMKMSNHVIPGLDQKWAVVYIPLAPAVTRDDYPALKAAVEAIAGIQNDVQLLVDGVTRDTLPEGKEPILSVEVHQNRRDVPEE